MPMTYKVFIEGGPDPLYVQLFQSLGFEITIDLEQFINETPYNEVNLICFTGGHDVHPDLYDTPTHPHTSYSFSRDEHCMGVYTAGYLTDNVGLVGICRGAQFLNVMNGGSLYQHVEGHTTDHEAWYKGTPYLVSSTHHQMMIPSDDGETLVHGGHIARKREWYDINQPDPHPMMLDQECVYYKDTKSLCFQPHPEFYKEGDPCYELFREILFHDMLGD